MKSKRDVSVKTSEDYEPPPSEIEKRVMLTVALFGSFAFGFIFFGNAPSILALQVVIGPGTGANLAARLLGGLGLVTLAIALYGRKDRWWRAATTLGGVLLFVSWGIFFAIVNANIMTLLGTTPFLFVVVWFLSDAFQSSRVIGKLQTGIDDRYSSKPKVAYQRVRRSGFFSGALDSLRRWLRADDLK